MTGSSKSPPSKGKPITVWLVAAIALVLAICAALYMVWRRAGSTEIEMKASAGSVDKARLEITQLQGEVKNRDEKITTLTEKLADQDKKIIELQYQMRDIKRSLRGGGTTTSPTSKRVICDDTSCTVDAGVEDIDDL